jgi:hypothetical protein
LKNPRKFEIAARSSGKRSGINPAATNNKQNNRKKSLMMKTSIKFTRPGFMALVAAAGFVFALSATASKAFTPAFVTVSAKGSVTPDRYIKP